METAPAEVSAERPPFAVALHNFLALLQAKMIAHHAKHFPGSSLACETFEHTMGPKYVRVTKHMPGSMGGSAYCFVSRENGDVLKPAGFKTPAKHARGNIYDADPVKGCGPYGVAYLR